MFYDLITANTNFVQNTAVRVPPFFNRSRITGTTQNRIDFPNAYFTQAALLAGNRRSSRASSTSRISRRW